jgi:TonB family protein
LDIPLSEISPFDPFPLVGQLLDGRYQILREIAVGGMSTVYEATHVKIGRTVAIKVLNRDMADDAEVVARFLNEARAVGTFGHPHIVASTDYGELPGHVPYLVLEYLQGHTLSHEIQRNGPLPVPRAIRIALQIASALEAAHSHGVVHRDLTSGNIFLTRKEGDLDHVKVLDFGISKFLTATDATPKTRRGLTMGTPEFMAPEQISAPENVDARADIYSLGIILHHMLAGKTPFGGLPLQALLSQIVVSPPPRLLRPEVPDGVRAIVGKALAKDPAQRFARVRDLGTALARFSSDASVATFEKPRRHRVLYGAIVLGAATACFAGYRLLASKTRPDPFVGAPVAGTQPARPSAPPPAGAPPAPAPMAAGGEAPPSSSSSSSSWPKVESPTWGGRTAHGIHQHPSHHHKTKYDAQSARHSSARPLAAAPAPASSKAGQPAPGGDGTPAAAPPAPRPPPAPASASAGASFDSVKAQTVVRNHLHEIQRCYERGKMDDSDLRGRVTVRIAIGPDGNVSSAEVESSSLGSSGVESCIVSTVEGWKFPAPTGGSAVISYPFNLR